MHIGTWDIGLTAAIFAASFGGCWLGGVLKRRKAQRRAESEGV